MGRAGRLERWSRCSSLSESLTSHNEDDPGLWRTSAAEGLDGSAADNSLGSSAPEAKLESSSADHLDVTVDKWDLKRSDDWSGVNSWTVRSDALADCEVSTHEPDDEGARIVGYWINTPLSTIAWITEGGPLRDEEVRDRE